MSDPICRLVKAPAASYCRPMVITGSLQDANRASKELAAITLDIIYFLSKRPYISFSTASFLKDIHPNLLMVEEQIKAIFDGDRIVAAPSDVAREFYDKSRYGELKDKKYQYPFVEGLYLVERGKMVVTRDSKVVSFDDLLKDERYYGKYVCVIGKEIVDYDVDERELMIRTYEKYPNAIALIGKITMVDEEDFENEEIYAEID